MSSEDSADRSPAESVEGIKDIDAASRSIRVVGIGASAGGLEAFTQLLRHLPTNTGMAFVLIQHLDPTHKSLLTELLARETQMPVSEVTTGLAIAPNQVYVIPPNRKMILVGNALELSVRAAHGKPMPVDTFFQSLALERGSEAIGVVLSGSDGDGAASLEAIKAAGGVTFAQDMASSQFGDMPQSAVNTGQVDFVLPPPQIAEELGKISRREGTQIPPATPPTDSLAPISLSQVFALLRAATGVDFTDYKQATLNRRILRRMTLHRLERLEEYVTYLQANPTELQMLQQDLLINVTSFFRDPEAFQILKAQVFPRMIQHQATDFPLRIWVAGCATGQEAYSIAICLLEFLEDQITQPQIQIFATDLNETAIEIARAGIYKESEVEGVSPERLRQFFTPIEGRYQIGKSVRELCVFAKQNLISDPPFSALDLISCRNVLIYLGANLQRRVLPTFHYGLKPLGCLMLGTSETIDGFTDLFAPIDTKYKIYAKKLAPARLNLSFIQPTPIKSIYLPAPMTDDATHELNLQQTADRIVWERYAPAGVVINADLEILQFRGDTRAYLAPAPGKPSFDLLKMAHPDLRLELRAALRQAKKQNSLVRKQGLRIAGVAASSGISIEVLPFGLPPSEDRYFLVLFEATPLSRAGIEEAAPAPVRRSSKQAIAEQRILQLAQELEETKAHLQTIIEEQEASNQDLRVANEEILSSNEELQSTNEELQTAKEEIQASNEELRTVNDELRSRSLESDRFNNDLVNILNSATLPILILGNDLKIRRFTPMAEQLFNLIPTDVGRSFSDIRHNLNLANLEQLTLRVIDTLNIHQQEVQDQEGRWYNLIIRPYKTRDNQIMGGVIVLVDIDALKHSAQQLQEARNYATAIVETVTAPLMVLNADLHVVTANRAFYEMFQVSSAQTENRLLYELGNRHWDIPQLRSRLEATLTQNMPFQNFEVAFEFDPIGRKTLLLNARQILNSNDHHLILLAIEDITERQQFEAERTQLLAQEQASRADAEAASRAKDVFLSVLSHELRNPLNAILGWSELLREGILSEDEIQPALQIIERNARIQNQLIGDLLDISRIISGRLSLDAKLMDLDYVIETAIETVSLAAEAKDIEIVTRLELLSQGIWGDAVRLQQVIWNILANAIKFTPAGGRVEVELSLVMEVEPTSTLSIPYAQIQISDTGEGISADFLPYVFDRFLQGDGSYTRAHGGLGIGLTIVRHLVELHGGTVQAASPGEGLGTTFTIKLPLVDQPEDPALLSSPPAELLEEALPTLSGLSLLVVDDEADVRTLLSKILEQHGAAVTAVASAHAALQALAAERFDVILCDIGIPEQDGNALMRQVRQLSDAAGGKTPAAALTAYVSDVDQRAALAAGFQIHLAKPVKSDHLVAIVANLAGRT
ncbi:MAG TPA: chemotaxis protein CheB [Coleofasciculaceae cyanobacterium]|jgi:two-component system CheB/CheR fusion protein